MQRPHHPRRVERGFTLVEFMVVVVITGILIGFTYSGFTGMLARYRCQGAMNRIAQVFKLAQMKAIEQSVDYILILNAGNETLSVIFDHDDNTTTAPVLFEQIDLAQEYRGIDMLASSSCNGTRFNYRGMPRTATGALGNCTIRLNPTNKPTELGNVTISSMGRIQVATPDQWKY
jgi:prepilin-type N-terminal cleavage/methylation domain-containing protein